MSSLRPLVKPAIKVAAAGLGAVAGGPLGAALGGMLGEESSKLIEKYVEKAGEKILEESGEGLGDRLKAEGPTLEAAYRTALKMSLKKIAPKAGGEFDDWFKHWERCLSSEEILEFSGVEVAEFTPRSIDRLLERVLVRLDAQGAALLGGDSSLRLAERTMPGGLIDVVREKLPERLPKAFRALILSERYESAWRELVSASQERLEILVDSVKGDTTALREDTAAMDAKLDQLLRLTTHLAVEKGSLTDAEARAATAEAAAEEWKEKYLELVKENPSLDELLLAGDLDAAAEKKREQIARQREEEAKNYFELGRIEELRFDYAKATEAYGEAWRLTEDRVYGFNYALCAQHQNRFEEAIKIFERLRELFTDPGRIASVLHSLGIGYREIKQFDDAERAYDEALKIRRELAKQNPEAYLPRVAATLNNLGNLYLVVPRLKEAERAYHESLKIFHELASQNNEAYLPDVAMTLNNLANLYDDVRQPRRAERLYDEVLKTYRKLALRNPKAHLPDVAMALNNLAIVYRGLQKFKEAEAAYDEALRIRRELAKGNPQAYLPSVATTLSNLANLYDDVKEIGKAELSSQEAEKILMPFWLESQKAYGDTMARVLGCRAGIWLNTGRSRSEVCELAQRALSAGPSAAYRARLEKLISTNCSSKS